MKRKYFLLLVFFLASICHAQWVQTKGPEGGMVYCLESEGDNVFAGTSGGLYFSSDFGITWKLLKIGLPITSFTCLILKGTTIYTGTSDGVYRSDDFGKNWRSINNGLPIEKGIFEVRYLTSIGNNLFASISGNTIQDPESKSGIYLSQDGGNSWMKVLGMESKTPMFMKLKSNESSIIACDLKTGSIYRSLNGGIVWSKLKQTGSGVFELSGNKIYFGPPRNGLFFSSDSDASWTKVRSVFKPNATVNKIKIFGKNIYVGVFGEGIFISNDDGTNWSFSKIGLPDKIRISDFAKSGEKLLLSAYERGIYSSLDNGKTWEKSNHEMLSSQVLDMEIKLGNLFAWTPDGLFSSIDRGETWSNLMIALPTNQEFFSSASTSIRFDIYEFSNIYFQVSRAHEILPLRKAPPRVDKEFQHFFAQVAIGSNFILGGSSAGIFTTVDSGNTWVNINEGLSQLEIATLAYDDSFLYAATCNIGVWKRRLSEIIKSGLQPSLANEIPLKFELYQNYPNPFNSSTTISFTIPNPANVKLKIYNLVGEEVKTLISENLKEGIYKINWAANNIASGVYIYRLQADKRVDVKKMILVK